MNPLIFIPSVREIPRVIESWNELPYDKYVVRMKLEAPAYQDGRDFFLSHSEYTHIVIAPDDMVVDYDSFMTLQRDVKEYRLTNVAGIANLGQDDPDVYSCKPIGVPFIQKTKGSYYDKNNIPNELFTVGFTGFACQWLERELVEKLSFKGWCNNGQGCMDAQFSTEMNEMVNMQIVDPKTYFPHLRNEQYDEVKAWKAKGSEFHIGYTVHLTDGQKYE